jgi:hypothetical protein
VARKIKKQVLKIKNMKNFKKIALGLMVGAVALGFSAFTNAPVKAEFTTRFWVNDGTNYNLLSGTPDPADDCTAVSAQPECAVESSDGTIPNTFSNSNPLHYSISTFPGSSLYFYNKESINLIRRLP